MKNYFTCFLGLATVTPIHQLTFESAGEPVKTKPLALNPPARPRSILCHFLNGLLIFSL